jgi:hypothetical protein
VPSKRLRIRARARTPHRLPKADSEARRVIDRLANGLAVGIHRAEDVSQRRFTGAEGGIHAPAGASALK